MKITDQELFNALPFDAADVCELCDEAPATRTHKVKPFQLGNLTITEYRTCDHCAQVVLEGGDWEPVLHWAIDEAFEHPGQTQVERQIMYGSLCTKLHLLLGYAQHTIRADQPAT